MDTTAKVYEILKSFSTTMLVTLGPGKHPEARPMQIAKVEEGGNLWFFTGAGARVVAEISDDPMVLLVFQEERSAYLSLRGRARVVKDKARATELWREPYKVWFPGGLDDPELTLMAVEPVSAEYWDSRGMKKLEYMFEAAKAYLKGEQPAVGDPDQHAKVNL